MLYDINWNIIDESQVDLSIGVITPAFRPKKGVIPVDNITKFVYEPDEMEEVRMYIIDEHRKARKEMENQPTRLDRIEAQVAYIAMMTGNSDILEV